jgi:hypothetical protein
MKNAKNLITLFFVTLFLLFKVASLHALAHQYDDSAVEHCETCHITTAVSLIPLLETGTTTLPKTEFYFLAQKINSNTSLVVYNNQHLSSYLFTRPPPQSS